MKYNNKISKVTILSCLLLGTIANAQNFYTCVPKESYLKTKAKEEIDKTRDDAWFRKMFNLMQQQGKLALENKLKAARSQINNDKVWNLVAENKTEGFLDHGIYKVIVAGAVGGRGGDASIENDTGMGMGGAGEIKTDLFYIDKKIQYYSCIGKQGYGGGYIREENAPGGGGGAGSAFAIHDINFAIYVFGGGGGGGDCERYNDASGGGGAGGYGCSSGGRGGGMYINNLGLPGGDVVKSPGIGIDFYYFPKSVIGGEGRAPSLYRRKSSSDRSTPGIGGSNSINSCANGGVGALDGGNGGNGGTCASPGNENPGDGYVKIYKYIG